MLRKKPCRRYRLLYRKLGLGLGPASLCASVDRAASLRFIPHLIYQEIIAGASFDLISVAVAFSVPLLSLQGVDKVQALAWSVRECAAVLDDLHTSRHMHAVDFFARGAIAIHWRNAGIRSRRDRIPVPLAFAYAAIKANCCAHCIPP